MPQTKKTKLTKGRSGKFLSLIVGAALIVGFGIYAASSNNTKNSHAEPANIYSANCAGPNYPVLKLGNTGNCVYYLQQIFHDSGFATPVTGKFDAATNSAVVFFQYNAKLPDNGVVDAATWGALGKYGKSSPVATAPAPKPTTTPTPTTPTTTPTPTKPTTTPTPTPTPAPTAVKPTNTYASLCTAPRPTLEYSATGNCVKFLQQIFKDAGFATPVTGTFDKATLAAVVFYQSNKKETASGIANSTLWGDLTGNSQVTTQVLGTAVPSYLPNDPYADSCQPPRPILQEGATGNCVKLLQQIFHDIGFGTTVTGTFDAATRSAVAYYQSNKKETASGVVNSTTWGDLTGSNKVSSQTLGTGYPKYLANNPYDASCQAPRPILQESATGNCVKFVQEIFKLSGFNVTVSGTFDPATKSAVVYYQAVQKLPNNGVVNAATWGALTYDNRVTSQVLGNGTWPTPASGQKVGSGNGGGNNGGGCTGSQCTTTKMTPTASCGPVCVQYLTLVGEVESTGVSANQVNDYLYYWGQTYPDQAQAADALYWMTHTTTPSGPVIPQNSNCHAHNQC